jgi:hypothetical protein
MSLFFKARVEHDRHQILQHVLRSSSHPFKHNRGSFTFPQLKQKIEEYNGALLKDKETYPGWPLLPYPTSITLSGEVESLK